MNCPKCRQDQPNPADSCAHCGIVFAKYFKYYPPDEESSGQDSSTLESCSAGVNAEDRSDDPGLRRLLLGDPNARPGHWTLRALLLGGFALWSWHLIGASIASNYAGESFLHLINLPFHEAGHVLFRPLGTFMTSLGGTLGQLLIPAICGIVLLVKTRDAFGAAVSLWWFGENFLDIAPYINDAQAGELPLLGGNFGHSAPYGFHDWAYLLTESGLLAYDHTIAGISHTLGSVVMLLGLLWGAILLHHQRQNSQKHSRRLPI